MLENLSLKIFSAVVLLVFLDASYFFKQRIGEQTFKYLQDFSFYQKCETNSPSKRIVILSNETSKLSSKIWTDGYGTKNAIRLIVRRNSTS